MADAKQTNTDTPPTATEPSPTAELLQEVQLTAPHTHAGREYLAGENIQVTPDVKQWLSEHNKIQA